MEAWIQVKANKGSAGIDNETVENFEKNLKDNLYKIWNRMSSGSYYPPHVKLVEIDKKDGGKRPLGIPTVSDRIAQMVCKIYLEPTLNKIFHNDSYGYRPYKSALQAIGKCRERCWIYDWVIDLDIKGFFDNINHELMMKAVKRHTNEKWIIMYIERWLKASIVLKDGTVEEREKGTPQGGVISPLLANLFLHYVLDKWLEKNQTNIKFERYADDCIIHCTTRKQAKFILERIKERLKECRLELHPEKTKIIYCRDDRRHYEKEYENYKFDFLGYTFRPRKCKNKEGKIFIAFCPAISDKACMKIKETMRKWEIRRWTRHNIEEIAEAINKVVRGWINYYGKYYKSATYSIFKVLNEMLVKWVKRRHKRFRESWIKARKYLGSIAETKRSMFVHWEFGVIPRG